MASDPDLASRFTDEPATRCSPPTSRGRARPALLRAAQRRLAPGGVAVVAPTSGRTTPSSSTRSSARSPPTRWSSRSPPTSSSPSSRRRPPAVTVVGRPPSGAATGLPVTAIRTQRQRINAFATAAPGHQPLTEQLGDLVLAGESELLRPAQQSAVLHNARRPSTPSWSSSAVAGGQSITLTSQQRQAADRPSCRLRPTR